MPFFGFFFPFFFLFLAFVALRLASPSTLPNTPLSAARRVP
jgi:hypothetical protein